MSRIIEPITNTASAYGVTLPKDLVRLVTAAKSIRIDTPTSGEVVTDVIEHLGKRTWDDAVADGLDRLVRARVAEGFVRDLSNAARQRVAEEILSRRDEVAGCFRDVVEQRLQVLRDHAPKVPVGLNRQDLGSYDIDVIVSVQAATKAWDEITEILGGLRALYPLAGGLGPEALLLVVVEPPETFPDLKAANDFRTALAGRRVVMRGGDYGMPEEVPAFTPAAVAVAGAEWSFCLPGEVEPRIERLRDLLKPATYAEQGPHTGTVPKPAMRGVTVL